MSIANHGAEALAILEQSTYWNQQAPNGVPADHAPKPIPLQVILMDIEMPVMDGVQCTKQIRLLQSEGIVTGHVPVVYEPVGILLFHRVVLIRIPISLSSSDPSISLSSSNSLLPVLLVSS